MRSPLPLFVVIGAIVFLGATGNLFAPSPVLIAVQLAAIGLSIWARRSFRKGAFRVTAAPAGSIIRTGPYNVVRHPMYAAVLLFIWIGVLSHLSPMTIGVGLVVLATVVARVIVEERLLRAQYAEYDEYARSTKALVPYVF